MNPWRSSNQVKSNLITSINDEPTLSIANLLLHCLCWGTVYCRAYAARVYFPDANGWTRSNNKHLHIKETRIHVAPMQQATGKEVYR